MCNCGGILYSSNVKTCCNNVLYPLPLPCPPPPTNIPTRNPTPPPTNNPTLSPTPNPPTPVPLVPISHKISLGERFGLVIRNGAYSFGLNDHGQLGDGNRPHSTSFYRNPRLIFADAESVACGTAHSCLIDSSGELFCFGNSASGATGMATDESAITEPTLVPLDNAAHPILSVSCGAQSTFVIDSQGRLFGFGSNSKSQLAKPYNDPHSSSSPIPIEISEGGVTNVVVAVSAGGQHVCAITSAQQLFCWGDGLYGRLGNGGSILKRSPTKVAQGESSNLFSIVSCGSSHTCAIDSEDKVLCWGNNLNGRLGIGGGSETATKPVPTLVVFSEHEEFTGSNTPVITNVAAGGQHTCIYNSNHAWCFGRAKSLWIPKNDTIRESSSNFAAREMYMDGVNGISELDVVYSRTCIKDMNDKFFCFGSKQQIQNDVGYVELELDPEFVPTRNTEPAQNAGTTTISDTTAATSVENENVPGKESENDLESDTENITEKESDSSESDNQTMFIIIGACAAAVLMILCAVFVILKHITGKRKTSKSRNMKKTLNQPNHGRASQYAASRSASRKASQDHLHRRRSTKLPLQQSSNNEYGLIGPLKPTQNPYDVVQNQYMTIELGRSPPDNQYDTVSSSLSQNPSVTGNSPPLNQYDTVSSSLSQQPTVTVNPSSQYESVSSAL